MTWRRISLSAVAALWALACVAHAQDSALVPVTVDGETVKLMMRWYKPDGAGPFPTVVFNHGSTGRGNDPALFDRPVDFPQLGRFLVERGWAVVIPARRGRGGSEGRYDEGFSAARTSGYSCEPTVAIAGAERALRDIAAAIAAIVEMGFVDRTRLVIAGQSRGGILSTAYAGRHGDQVKGAINFVGGWLGTRCDTAAAVNQALFVRGAGYPQPILWIYGDNDSFYALSHSRANFAAFRGAGGRGEFLELQPPAGTNGHRVIGYPELWGAQLEAYLQARGLPSGRP